MAMHTSIHISVEAEERTFLSIVKGLWHVITCQLYLCPIFVASKGLVEGEGEFLSHYFTFESAILRQIKPNASLS